jgi:hypothetical protein
MAVSNAIAPMTKMIVVRKCFWVSDDVMTSV